MTGSLLSLCRSSVLTAFLCAPHCVSHQGPVQPPPPRRTANCSPRWVLFTSFKPPFTPELKKQHPQITKSLTGRTVHTALRMGPSLCTCVIARAWQLDWRAILFQDFVFCLLWPISSILSINFEAMLVLVLFVWTHSYRRWDSHPATCFTFFCVLLRNEC